MPDVGKKKRSSLARTFDTAACAATQASGTSWAFMTALAIIVVWAVTGPLFHFSDTWQLVINTGTTVVTFLMVFLIQHTQNKDSLAVQLKLDEILAALPEASNKLIDIEDLDADELEELRSHYQQMVDRVKEKQKIGRKREAG
jgi:low affinity Fe/Cu permease